MCRARARAGKLLATRSRPRRLFRGHPTRRELHRREPERRGAGWRRHWKWQRCGIGNRKHQRWRYGWRPDWRHWRHWRRRWSGREHHGRNRWAGRRWRLWSVRRYWRYGRGSFGWRGWSWRLGRRSVQAARDELFQPERLLQCHCVLLRHHTHLLRRQRMRERLGLLHSRDHRVFLRAIGLLSRRGTALSRFHLVLPVARLPRRILWMTRVATTADRAPEREPRESTRGWRTTHISGVVLASMASHS